MVIERISVRCFRSLLELDLACDELMVIVGRNGSGKSSLLKALDVFYNLSFVPSPFDYFAKDTNQEIKISITYSGLRPDEADEFASQLTDGKLTVAKVIKQGGGKYFGASRQIPQFNEIRGLSAVPKRQALNQLIDAGTFPSLGPKVSSGPAADSLMDQYEVIHPELTQVYEKEQQFFGPRNIGGGKLDKYTKFVLIPAVRDASSEAERRGVIYQLIDILVARSVNARADVRQLNTEFEKKIKEVYSKDNLTELGTLAIEITDLLSDYAPGAELDLDFEDIVPPRINLPAALASVVEDNFKSPIGYSGHGVQRALVLALLQKLSLTEAAASSLAATQEQEQQGAVDAVRAPDLILAIEEPELYLHPSRARYLYSVLNSLAKKPEGVEEPRTQVIYATHSPYFIDLARFDEIRLACKVPTPGLETRQCRITSYKRLDAATQLGEISGKDPASFTADSFVAHAVPVMNSIVSEGFFADVVVVVEGLTEVGILTALQEILGKAWDANGITIVPAGGKNNIDRPVVVFRGLKIPTYFLFDGDSHHTGEQRSRSAEKNRAYQRLAGVEPVDFPSTQAHEYWAVFNKHLEAELSAAIGDAYADIRRIIANELGYDEPSNALKNTEGAARLIKRAYALGHKVQILEEVVNFVTALR